MSAACPECQDRVEVHSLSAHRANAHGAGPLAPPPAQGAA